MSKRKEITGANTIARELVGGVDVVAVSAIEDGLTEFLSVGDLQRLLTAVETKFAEYEKRFEQDEIDEDAYLAIIAARQTAYFHLGFHAAMKLMGRTIPASLKAVG